MYSIVFALAVVFSSLNCIESWRNYKINLLSTKIDHANPDYITMHKMEIKKINRTQAYFNANWTLHQITDNYTFSMQFYSYVSNRYKESFPKISLDGCIFISEEEQKDINGFVGTIASKMKVLVRDMIYAPGQKFPNKCPIPADNYYVWTRIFDEDKLPPFFLPAGRWKLQCALHLNQNILMVKGNVVFEIVNYLNEKQKKRG